MRKARLKPHRNEIIRLRGSGATLFELSRKYKTSYKTIYSFMVRELGLAEYKEMVRHSLARKSEETAKRWMTDFLKQKAEKSRYDYICNGCGESVSPEINRCPKCTGGAIERIELLTI